jgi:hypothetical protein
MLATSAMSVLVTAAIWWVTWPRRTVDNFISDGRSGNWSEAHRIYGEWAVGRDFIQTELDDEATTYWRDFFAKWQVSGSGTASPIDFVVGRRTFYLIYDDITEIQLSVTVQRGVVVFK